MPHQSWLLSTAIIIASPVFAAASEPAQPQSVRPLPGSQPAPGNVADWADRLTDTTVNGWAFKDPKNFPKLIELFSDPSIYLEFARRMQDPVAYARVVGQMLDPATARNYLEWSDPAIYTRWSQALADPDFYTATLKPLADPATLMRWATLPIDQRAWSVGLNTMNPVTWLKWMTAGVNPKVMSPLAKALDPTTPLRWLQAVANPANIPLLNGGLASATGQGNGAGTFTGAMPAAKLAQSVESKP
jgi:hypothetical protein